MAGMGRIAVITGAASGMDSRRRNGWRGMGLAWCWALRAVSHAGEVRRRGASSSRARRRRASARLRGVLPLLRQASELAPDNARYAYFHAIALNAAGAPAQAMALLGQAHRRHPTDTDLLVALVSLARDGSDPRTALRYARELAALRPADPRIRALVLDLEEHR